MLSDNVMNDSFFKRFLAEDSSINIKCIDKYGDFGSIKEELTGYEIVGIGPIVEELKDYSKIAGLEIYLKKGDKRVVICVSPHTKDYLDEAVIDIDLYSGRAD